MWMLFLSWEEFLLKDDKHRKTSSSSSLSYICLFGVSSLVSFSLCISRDKFKLTDVCNIACELQIIIIGNVLVNEKRLKLVRSCNYIELSYE